MASAALITEVNRWQLEREIEDVAVDGGGVVVKIR